MMYLLGCEAAFGSENIKDTQTLILKPMWSLGLADTVSQC